MKFKIISAVFCFGLFTSSLAFARTEDWTASMGMGVTIEPTTFLLNPSLEYSIRPNLTFGPNLQLGLSSGVLFAAAASIRYFVPVNHPRLRPFGDAGLGMAFGSGAGSSSVGVLIHFGMGLDYVIDNQISVGTVLRANLAPPLQTFFFSWPIVVGRFRI